MNGIIIYRTKYGSTKDYAEMIGKDINSQVFSYKSTDITLHNADFIVIGCSIIAGKFTMAKWIKKHWDVLKDKNIILYSTSISHPNDPELQDYFTNNFDNDIQSKIKYFPLHGRIILDKMNFIDKAITKLVRKTFKADPQHTYKTEDFDGVRVENLAELLSYIKNL